MVRKKVWVIALLIVVALMMIIWPIVSLQTSTKNAQQQITNVEDSLKKTSLLYESQKKWFRPNYFNFSLGKLEDDFDGAKKMFSESSGFEKKIVSNKKVISVLKQLKNDLDNILEILQSNEQQKENAFKLLSDLKLEKNQLNLVEVKKRFEKESGDFLEKYRKQFLNNFSLVERNIFDGDKNLKTAELFLPKLDSKDKQGDPLEAVKNLEITKKKLSEAKSLIEQSVKDLDYQIEAKKNVSSKLNEALQEINKAKNVLDETERKYKFSKDKALSLAYLSLDKAIKANDDSVNIFHTVVEGNKIDYVLAYDLTKMAIDLSKKAVDENKLQLTAYKNALVLAKTVEASLSTTKTTLMEAKRSYDILFSNHNRSCWSSIYDNYSEFENDFLEAKRLKTLADEQMSFLSQKFVDADNNYQKSLDLSNKSKQKGMEIISLTDSLEEYKNQWYVIVTTADATINAEESLVVQYGSYNTSARSDYDRAVSLLASSRAKAIDRLYQEAVDLAKQASLLVSGTGQRCKNSYEDDQDSNNNFWNSNNNGNNGLNNDDNGNWNNDNDGGGFDAGGGDDGGGWGDDGGDDGGGWDNGGGDDGGGFDAGGGDDGGGW